MSAWKRCIYNKHDVQSYYLISDADNIYYICYLISTKVKYELTNKLTLGKELTPTTKNTFEMELTEEKCITFKL